MIEFDTFYREYQNDIRSINDKLDKQHDSTDKKISDLCDRVTRMETQRDVKIDSHKTQIRLLGVLVGALSIIVGFLNLLPKIQALTK